MAGIKGIKIQHVKGWSRVVLSCLCMAWATWAQAASYTTVVSGGNFSAAGTWSGAQPPQGGGTDVSLVLTNLSGNLTLDWAGAFMLNQMTNVLYSGNANLYASGVTPAAYFLFTNTSAGTLPTIYCIGNAIQFNLPVTLATNLIITASNIFNGHVIFQIPAAIVSDTTPSSVTINGNAGAYVTFRGANTYRGATIINGGSLILDNSGSNHGSINKSTNISIAAGATLDVSSITNYSLSTNSTLTASGAAATATIKGNATGTINLGAQAITLNYDGADPALTISQGSLVLGGNAFTVNSFSPWAAGNYTIINCASGTITTNNPNFTVTGTAISTGQTGTLVFSNNQVILQLSGSAPATALNDPRYALGYLVVTYYPGVTNNGTGDCRAGIQSAINDAFAANLNFETYGTGRPLAVFFPPGTYQISDILECYQWAPTNMTALVLGNHILIGSTEGTNRPLIRLMAGAANYQNSAAPRQMISFRKFQGGFSSGGAYPSPAVPVTNPMSTPTGYTDYSADLFWDELRNIDFDCNGNPGAVGVTLNGAQRNAIENVKVTATGAFAGFFSLPGAGSFSANLEVEGGQYGIIHGNQGSLGLNIEGGNGPVIAGMKLQNQTVAAMMLYDYVSPISVVGFQITNSKSIIAHPGYWNGTAGSLSLLDGQIGIGGGTNVVAIDNSLNYYGVNGRDIYVRNVYVTGTTNLVKSKSTTTTGSGTWSLIKEYSYNNTYNDTSVPPNTGYLLSDINFESYSLVNGTVGNYLNPFPISPNIVTNSTAPPSNLVSEHLWASFPSYNGATNDPPTVVVSTSAGLNNTNDDTMLLQAAINQAATNNGRVFLPAGHYYITNTLTLYSNTVLLGVGEQLSQIQANSLWQPTTGEVTMVQTADDAGAKTTLAWLTLATRQTVTSFETNYSRFNALNWRAGANSLVLNIEIATPWTAYLDTQPHSLLKYTGNGGGKLYGLCMDAGPDGERNPGFRKLTITNTTQPLWFYGFNMEHGLGDMEVQITGASNVRMLGYKREGTNAMLVISNSSNIACYSAGAMLSPPNSPGSFQILGASTNVLLATLCVQQVNTPPQLSNIMVYEALTGQPTNVVSWPNMVSLYKRGEINDSLMFLNSVPLFAQPMVRSGNLILTGTDGSANCSYRLLTSTNVALPAFSWTPVLTNTFGSDGSFSNTVPIASSARQSFYRLITP